jgi:hypothetical protein
LFHIDSKYRKQQKKLNGKTITDVAERTRRRFVANIISLPNIRRRCASKEHVWTHGNRKSDRIEVLEHYEDQKKNENKNSDPEDWVICVSAR